MTMPCVCDSMSFKVPVRDHEITMNKEAWQLTAMKSHAEWHCMLTTLPFK